MEVNFRQKVPTSGWSLLVPAMELDCGCGGGANIKTEKSKAACFKRPCHFVLYFAGSGSFPQPHSATLTGRT